MLINTWPIDESYVESTPGAAKPGIIDDISTYPDVSGGLISALNAKEGETSISTGYHVIEYLLWGQDTRADGPGNRSYADYVVSGRGAVLARRRSTYLHVATELLVRHLQELVAAWAPASDDDDSDRHNDRHHHGPDNYRASFLRRPAHDALGLVVKGMGALGGPELAGERLTVAYETKDQENEHSCFSDNTHNDIVLDALGIENVCLGRYQRSDGSAIQGRGVCDWVALVDTALGARLKSDIAGSVAAARAIPPPFDQAILGNDSSPGRQKIHHTIQALEHQTETLAEVAAAFHVGLTLASSARSVFPERPVP